MSHAGTAPALPNAEQLMWALQIAGGDAIAEITGLRAGGSPFLLRWVGDDGTGRVVLRIDDATEAGGEAVAESVMPIADRQGVPVPNVLGSRIDDEVSLLLTEWIDGTRAQPVEADPARLESLGAMAAVIFRADPGEAQLPHISRPMQGADFAAMRASGTHPLLERAAERIAGYEPDDRIGLVHGDLWVGSTMWRDDRIVAVTDWDSAGLGPAGIDLGSLRLDAALGYGLEASDHVLHGWEAEAAREAESVAYWDVVAALCTPPDLGSFAGARITGTERPDLDRQTLVARRDAFLEDALARFE
ncbi:aminoglycoside phosphotransferase family protein [Gryllotalpicola reticulitermitis]|uniref:Aminoglycoside phosphotransferase family protein n=1 Tax=Gryllotalpicola reticulitermitis TaxID=1184153 RepID=A0ABV8Q7T5_9MICO